jgi:hypothetical protein
MKKAMIAGVLMVVASWGAGAQEPSAAPGPSNAAAEFGETSAAQVSLLNAGTEWNAPANAASTAGEASAAPAAPEPTPAARPRYLFGSRDDYRWQLGVGFEYFRFQSRDFNANMYGVNTSVAYYTNSWFGIEGQVLTGFSTSTFFDNEHAKIFGGLGGIRVGSRRARWEPWLHGLVGGGHILPKDPGNVSSLMAIAGGGVDYRLHARLSLRIETDWVYSAFFRYSQNNFQTVGGVVFHF